MTRLPTQLARAALIGCAVVASLPAQASSQNPGGPEAPLLVALQRDAVGNPRAVAAFWNAVGARTTPLVDTLAKDPSHVLATFLYRGKPDTKDVVLVAGPNGIAPFTDPRSHMRHLEGTDVWYVSHHLRPDAEFFYQFSVNPPAVEGDPSPMQLRPTLGPDPLNPLQYPEPDDPMASAGHGSIARMPAVPPNPWLAKRPGVAAGVVKTDTIAGAAIQGSRNVWSYASPGVAPSALRDARVLVVFDGGIYINRIHTPTILDNLYAERKIGPAVVVFIDNGGAARARDYYFSDAYDTYLIDDVLPWIARTYGVKPVPERTVLAGSSLGGLAAAYAVFKRLDVFGKALSQSGAFWPNGRDPSDGEPEWLVRQFARAAGPAKGEFFLAVGSHESTIALETTLLASNRHLRDVFQLKGFKYTYVEVPGDHEPVAWRRTLPDGLMQLLR
jgi:enterochelin esterase-like enzyme